MTDEHHRNVQPPSPWGLVAGIGLIGVVCLTIIAAVQGAGASVLREGRAVPATPVLTINGENAILSEVAEGKREILIVSPTCDICAAEMTSRVEEAERRISEGLSHELDQVLLLVIRGSGIPRSMFMTAYARLQELGMSTVFIETMDARAIGIEKVPGMILLRADGKIEEISYPEEA